MNENMPRFKGKKEDTPEWAVLEWKLIERMEEAVELFRKKYVRPDGTLIWRNFWPGMDGADDAFESFQNYPLLYMLGADGRLLELSHMGFDSVVWQWTEYGQLYREFFSYYDWMHHGEGNLFLYYMGLADPYSLKFRTRALRFASFYMGEDAYADNYNSWLKLIRSPVNGSLGPRLRFSPEDWETHRAELDRYLPPFEDMPGIPFVMGQCDWTGEESYRTILDFMNRRMASGDVPLNLNATSLIAHAYMYTGESKYREWITDYLGAWEDRTRRNGGVIPDNVGPNGEIGECMDGKWWGGYYGWRWPHGALTVVEPLITAGLNALLVTGERKWLDLARSQMDFLYESRIEDTYGKPLVPHRRLDGGWADYRRENTKWPVYIWSATMDEDDMRRIERLPDQELWGKVPERLEKGNRMDIHPWFHYMAGKNPDFPAQALRSNLDAVERRLDEIANDRDDINAANIHHWQDKNPVICEALVQLMLGGSTNIYHGGLMHTPLRYFTEGRPGLPRRVGALVGKAGPEGVSVSFHNAGDKDATFIIQGGCFGEHEIVSAYIMDAGVRRVSDWNSSDLIAFDRGSAGRMSQPDGKHLRAQPDGKHLRTQPEDKLLRSQPDGKHLRTHSDAVHLRVELKPGEGLELNIGLRRYANSPCYKIPGAAADYPPLISRRQIES